MMIPSATTSAWKAWACSRGSCEKDFLMPNPGPDPMPQHCMRHMNQRLQDHRIDAVRRHMEKFGDPYTPASCAYNVSRWGQVTLKS